MATLFDGRGFGLDAGRVQQMAAAAAQYRQSPGFGGRVRVGARLHVKLHAATDNLRDRQIPRSGNALEPLPNSSSGNWI